MLKEELRAKYKIARKQIPPGRLQEISELICENLFKAINLENKTISLFLPIERQNEINTYLIWQKAKSLDVKVAIPKANLETYELKHYLFESEDQLELSSLGIPEPKKGKVIAADRLDYVFVPLLAIDKNGHRVGYGKGFYDRLLKKCSSSCKFIGLNHFEEFETIDDLLATDASLDAIVTPKGINWFEQF
jgi:5-formyltetrahydrofolate cyclo-ligase